MDSQMKTKWTIFVVITSFFIILSIIEVGPFLSVKKGVLSTLYPDPPYKYAIVFDGGSTATRIHIFRFLQNTDGGFNLEDELFEEVKPGLSNFADEPNKATENVLHLLKKAKAFIPSHEWDNTPVALRATAGLRLLPQSASASILNEVMKVFKKSPFVCDNECVSILDGEDEGLYAWYTLNFLLGRLQDTGRSVVTMDLGGGSVQVTFTPVEFNTLFHSPKDYLHSAKVQNRTVSIYSHSYLGLGLMSARLSILEQSTAKLDSSEDQGKNALSSSCISPHVKTKWKHNLKDHYVRGRKDGVFGFKECYSDVVSFLGNSVDSPEELKNREVYALSYYFDRAFDLGIIGKNGGALTVGKYFHGCKKACSDEDPEMPFLCLDCTYIAALLHHGLGFNYSQELRMVKQIDGIETSWGLGAAFSMLNF